MESQQIINLAFALIGGLGGFMLNTVRDSLKDLQLAHDKQIEKVHQIETLVAGHYVKREDFIHITDKLFEKLDGINATISSQFENINLRMDAKKDKHEQSWEGLERRTRPVREDNR